MKRRQFLTTTVTASAIAMAGCGGGGSSEPAGEVTAEVTLTEDEAFDPLRVQVAEGEAVRWNNETGERRTVRANTEADDSNEWELDLAIEAGESGTHTFQSSGVYSYHDAQDALPDVWRRRRRRHERKRHRIAPLRIDRERPVFCRRAPSWGHHTLRRATATHSVEQPSSGPTERLYTPLHNETANERRSRTRGSGSDATTRRQVLAGAGALAPERPRGLLVRPERHQTRLGRVRPRLPLRDRGVQLNPWLSGSYPWRFYTMLFEVQSVQRPGGERRLGDVVEDVAIDGTTVTVTYSDEFSWWNGEPVTAQDQWVYERIQSAVSDEDRPAVTLDDEHTLVYEFDRALAEPLVLSHVVGGAVNTPAWLFGQWVDRLEDASTVAARGGRRREAPRVARLARGRGREGDRLRSVRTRGGVDEPTDARTLRGPPQGGRHLDSDAVVPRRPVGVPRQVHPAGNARRRQRPADGAEGSPADNVEQIARYPTTGGTKLALDWRNAHLGRLAVRRAILAHCCRSTTSSTLAGSANPRRDRRGWRRQPNSDGSTRACWPTSASTPSRPTGARGGVHAVSGIRPRGR